MRQALALHQAGRRAEAEAAYREVLARKSDHGPALHFLGLLLHQGGRSAEGLALMEQSLRLAPNNPDFLNNLGAVQGELGRVADSLASYRKAVAARPDHIGARDNLGFLQKKLGQLDAAEETFRGTLLRQPFHMRARIGLAETLQESARLDEAIAALREALAIRPKDADLNYSLGVCLMEKGAIQESAQHFRQALAINPGMARAHLMLSQVKRQEAPDPELSAMQALHGKVPGDSLERMQLAFGLGKANDDLKDFSRAFDFFAEGNAIRRKSLSYDTAQAGRDFEAMKAAFTPALLAEKHPSAIGDDTPIFVVGMPRSGTTLVEQIIASHPQVYGAGELSILKQVVGKAFPPTLPGGFPAGIAGVTDKALGEAGKAYLDALHARYPNWRHVTDKMPGNFMLIGLIHLMLPKAKIVHCARNAVATCLSIFKAHFRGDAHSYGYDLAELAEFHNLYTGMMAHWRSVLPGVVHDVRYEDFVADQEGQTRALIAHLGLPWDDACMSFHQTDRPVRTASAAQVRQPMYRGSVDLWKRYGDKLKPLMDRLDQSSMNG